MAFERVTMFDIQLYLYGMYANVLHVHGHAGVDSHSNLERRQGGHTQRDAPDIHAEGDWELEW